MKKISNRSIIGLLVIALLISVIGTIINVHRLGILQGDLLTGAPQDTGTGTSTITIATSTALDNQVTSIAFGSGFVNGSCTTCVMDSNAQHNQTGACCRDFSNVSSGFLLENTGNVNLSVNYSCSGSCTADTFIGGPRPRFEIKVTPNSVAAQTGEAGALDTATSCNGTSNSTTPRLFGWNITNNSNSFPEQTYAAIQTTAWLCGNSSNFALDFINGADAAVVDINLSIPVDAPTAAAKTATFTFTGHSS